MLHRHRDVLLCNLFFSFKQYAVGYSHFESSITLILTIMVLMYILISGGQEHLIIFLSPNASGYFYSFFILPQKFEEFFRPIKKKKPKRFYLQLTLTHKLKWGKLNYIFTMSYSKKDVMSLSSGLLCDIQ